MVSAQNNAPIMGCVQNTLVCFYYLTETFLTPEDVTPEPSNYTFEDGTEGYETMVDLSDFMDACVAADIGFDRLSDLIARVSKYYPDYVYEDENGYMRFANRIPGKIVASIAFPRTFTWSRKTDINERLPVVKIQDGVLLPDSGPLCKKSIGGMANSAIHPLWKGLNTTATAGPKQAADLVTELQFMTSVLMPRIGFSIGVSDCLPTAEAEKMVDRAIIEAKVKCEMVNASNKDLIDKENEINGILNEAMGVAPKLAKTGMNKRDRNALVIMKKSGAKGSDTNNGQIAGFVGQQNLNGVRIPFTLSNETRTLPHFLPNDYSPASRGFVERSYLKGLDFKEQWFHATGGRRGVIDTALKTSDSGYIQKKIVNAISDFKVWHDATTRNANGSVIQFAYGGDGMNAKELMNTKGLNYPFFMNCIVAAECLNSEAEQNPEYDDPQAGVGGRGELRKLNREEINILVSNAIQAGIPGCQTGVTEMITFNMKCATRVAVADVMLYECMIPRFCKRVKDEYEHAKAKNGYTAGLAASCSIGEPTTQLSQSRHDKIPLMLKHHSGLVEYWGGPIGEIVDHLISNYTTQHFYLSENSLFAHPVEVDVYVNTVDPLTSQCSWKKIKQISRHPARGGMIKVTTRSGRSTTTTLSHSHLRRGTDGIIHPVKGSDLVVGDFIPVCGKMNSQANIFSITTEGKTYPLDFDVGWLFGAYLSEGFVNNGQIGITNISPEFEKRCKTFAKRFGGTVRKTEIFKEIVIDGIASEKKYKSVTNHISGCAGFGRYLVDVCGTGSENKTVPAFALFAPEKFVSGLLRGYFDGDGNINAARQLVRVHSISKNLIETIALLLTRFGIFGSIGVEKPERKFPLFNYVLLRKHITEYSEHVGTDFSYKRDGLNEILAYLSRDNIKTQREDIDVIPRIGQVISNVAKPLGLQGYSRLYKRHEQKEYTGKETCKKYLDVFIENGASESPELNILRCAVNSNVIWDKIESLEYLDDPNELVYDLGVEDNHTFMLQSGIFTHNTLNSVDWNSLISIKINGEDKTELADHGIYVGPIGKFIDTVVTKSLLGAPDGKTNEGIFPITFHPNETEYVDVSILDAKVISVDARGKMHWKKLEAVTRHLPGGKMVKIKTRMGRDVVVTRSKSMLVRENNLIVEKAGADMVIGDLVPVVINSPKVENPLYHLNIDPIHTIDLSAYVGYIFGYYILHSNMPSGAWETQWMSLSTPEERLEILKFIEHSTSSTTTSNDVSRKIPSWAMISNLEFVKGLLDAFFSHKSKIAETYIFNGVDDIECECGTALLAICVAELCARLDIFAQIDGTKVILFARHALRFAERIPITDSNKKLEYRNFLQRCGNVSITYGGPHDKIPGVATSIVNGTIHRSHLEQIYWDESRPGNDGHRIFSQVLIKDALAMGVFFDEVISVEEVDPKDLRLPPGGDDPKDLRLQQGGDDSAAPKVYDLTVADTRNFTIFGGLCVRDTFHNAGNSAKDVTLGVPRFQEILNASGRPTKAGKPSKAGCTIYLKNGEMAEYLEEKVELEKDVKNGTKQREDVQERIEQIDNSSLHLMSELASPIACLYVSDIMLDYELCYLPVENDAAAGTAGTGGGGRRKNGMGKKPRDASPLGLITYEEYEPKWWVTLRKDLVNPPSFAPEAWVVILKLDTYKLYEHGLTTEQVAEAIEENSFGSKGNALACVPSPNSIGEIEVYLNFTEIGETERQQVDMPLAEKVSRYLVTPQNIEYYAMREVALDIIRKTQILGISGIAKTYVRQTPTGEWLIDTRGTNLTTILGLPGVDVTRTISDSMWEIYHVLGIEATRKFLIKEITKILSFDGTYINPRHICLLVDGMVRQGTISSVNRDGIPRDVGPIAKGMFEKAVDNFAEAAAFAEHDTMRGVAASVMFGTLAEVGTGMVEIKDAEKLPATRNGSEPAFLTSIKNAGSAKSKNGATIKRAPLKIPLKPKKK